MRIAATIHERIPAGASVSVQLLSAISVAIDQPQVAPSEAVRSAARAIADEHLARIGEITELVVEEEERLFWVRSAENSALCACAGTSEGREKAGVSGR